MTKKIKIGTYNANNLFDRFDDPYNINDDIWRKGFSTSPKKLNALYDLGARIRKSDIDILALQEIESYGALREFFKGHVGPNYRVKDIHSQESNDPRGIDLGIVSKFPFGKITTNKFTLIGENMHFSRDCLQAEISDIGESKSKITFYVLHLKSKFSMFDPVNESEEYNEDQQKSNKKRKLEIKKVIEIIKNNHDITNDLFVVFGDFNDTQDSDCLTDILAPDNEIGLVNMINKIPQDDMSPESTKKRPRDTHKWTRQTEDGKEYTTYSQIDYILVSKQLFSKFSGKIKIESRGNTQGSDHYLVWSEFNL